MKVTRLLSALIGAYRPHEWLEREAHTNTVIERAKFAKAESDRIMRLVESYRQADERLVKR